MPAAAFFRTHGLQPMSPLVWENQVPTGLLFLLLSGLLTTHGPVVYLACFAFPSRIDTEANFMLRRFGPHSLQHVLNK